MNRLQGSGLRVYTLIYLAFLYAPIVLLPIFAFNNATVIAFPLQGFTTNWFVQMAENPTLRQALLNSLLIAVSASKDCAMSAANCRATAA